MDIPSAKSYDFGMQIEELPNNMVYKEGSEFWVAADKAHSSWAHKLDWYINFLIAKVSQVKRQELSPELQTILSEEQIEAPKNIHFEKPNLYLATRQFLPNQALMIIPYFENNIPWLEELERVWLDLGKPSLRVFLPKGMQKESFIEFASKHLEGEVTFVCETTHPAYAQ